LLCLVSRRATHEAALPCCMLLLPLAFYAAVAAGGWTLDDARAYGWVGKLAPPGPTRGGGGGGNSGGGSGGGGASGSVTALAASLDFSLVDWGVVPQQLPVFCSMVVVVAFSSCLDVAAIEVTRRRFCR
jgi:SulP family sulfate permease